MTQAESGGMALPASTMTVCLVKSAPNDPSKMMQLEECTVSDVKTAGAKSICTQVDAGNQQQLADH